MIISVKIVSSISPLSAISHDVQMWITTPPSGSPTKVRRRFGRGTWKPNRAGYTSPATPSFLSTGTAIFLLGCSSLAQLAFGICLQHRGWQLCPLAWARGLLKSTYGRWWRCLSIEVFFVIHFVCVTLMINSSFSHPCLVVRPSILRNPD